MSERKHNARCEASRKKVCKCSCHGQFHGKDTIERRVHPDDRPMSIEMGGEVAQYMQALQGKSLECWCGNVIPCSGWMGYPHSNGLADKDGNRWWVFLDCDNCSYAWSYWKVANRAKSSSQLEMVTQ